MFTVVVQETGYSVLKYTACPAFSSLVERSTECHSDKIRFIEGEYVESSYMDFKGTGIMVNVFRLPIMAKVFLKDMNKQQAEQARKWKRYVQGTQMAAGIRCDANTYRSMLLSQARFTYKDDPIFLANLTDVINGMDNSHRLDLKVTGNMMVNAEGVLTVTDPIFDTALCRLATSCLRITF